LEQISSFTSRDVAVLTTKLDESASAGHGRIRSVSATLFSDSFMKFDVAIWEFANSWTGRRECGWGGADGTNHGYGDETFYIVHLARYP
jgi:hypothetical protein